jgi:hypothetical protein
MGPKRRADGTFDLVIHFELEKPLDRNEVAGWMDLWVSENRTRPWFGEDTVLSEHYSAPPAIERLDNRELVIRWPVCADSRRWRDWMAWFLGDFEYHHPVKSRKIAQGTES